MSESPTITATVDMRPLNYQLAQLAAALRVDGRDIMRAEAGQLAGQISDQIGPKTEAKGKKAVVGGIKKNFFALNPKIKPFMGAGSGTGDMHWLFGTNKKIKALVGAKVLDVQLGKSARQLRKIQRAPRGVRWKDLGQVLHTYQDNGGKTRKRFSKFNGVQHAIQIDRVIVDKSAFDAMVQIGWSKLGILKASFAYTADKLIGKKTKPFVARHLSSKAQGRAIFDESSLNNPEHPSITFGSTAKGVVENEHVNSIITGAIKYRSKILAEKVKKVISGYAYDLKTGQTFRPKAGQAYGDNVITAP